MRVFLIVMALESAAQAYGAGVFGYSGKPPAASCSECHAGGVAPSVTLTGPSVLAPGEVATYTLDIVTGASTAHAGFDVATSAGTLAPLAQSNESWLNGGEVTHTKNWPKGKQIQLMFQLQAPAQPTRVTLFATGLNSDGVDDTAGDAPAETSLAVDITVSADGGAPFDLATVDAVSSATARPVTADMGPPRDEPRWACEFAPAPGNAAGASCWTAALLALVLWRRARVRR